MRHILLAGLCSMLLVACGCPSKSTSSLLADTVGATVRSRPESSADTMPSRTPAEVRAVLEKLHSSNVNERADAMMKLRFMKGDMAPAIPVLIQMLGTDAKFPVARLLISSLSPRTRSCSSECTFGGEAAETLACIGRTSDELPGLLKDRKWQVRANAARALGGLKDVRAIDPLMSFLADTNEHPVVRGNAALALALMGAVPAVDPLIPLLKDKDHRVRGAAASALGDLRDPRALQPLIAALGDENAFVRRAVVGGLGGIGGPSVLDPLVRALRDPDRQVREVTASALGRLKEPRAVEPLMASLDDDYANVRINAARSLGELKDSRAVEPLIRMLKDDNESVRGAAAEALGQMNDPRALQPLSAMAYREESEIPLVRALQSLAALGHAGGEEACNRYRTHRPDWNQWWSQNKAELLQSR